MRKASVLIHRKLLLSAKRPLVIPKTKLRKFMEMVNQLGEFSPQLAKLSKQIKKY